MKHELIEKVAWLEHPPEGQPVKGMVLRFSGLGGTTGLKYDADVQEIEWIHAGAMVVHPYHNPWAWMNGATVQFVDELITAIIKKYKLSDSVPIIATGGSMGGHASLTYTLKSKHKIIGSYASCPVCDLLFHYSERSDLPRTFHSAFGSYDQIENELKDFSPLHQAAQMPRIKYFVIHGLKDQAVSKANHSDKLIPELKKNGHDVIYREESNMGHCSPMTYEAYRAATDFVTEFLV